MLGRWSRILCLPCLALAGLALTPRPAAACGGTFCDGATPSPMPVDQTGEDILFIRDGDEVEVHVRIQYTGAAERFAWMIPVPAVPEVSIGVDAVFEALSAATLPVWDKSINYEDPNDNPGSNGSGGGFVPDDDLGGSGGGGPNVVFDETVGSYEVVVLEGGTASEVIQFFIDNDYAFEDDAEPLIQEYIDEGNLITGVKLVADAEVESIHPLAFRFVSDEPCIPIRLTAVAVTDDMPIRAYFLGADRWGPANYKHVIINPMAFDWAGLAFNTYMEALSLAVDEAGGQAFVTEFAGPSWRVALDQVYQGIWSSEEIASLSPHEVLLVLRAFELLPYPGAGPGPQVRLLLREFMTPPDNWPGTEDQFWWALMTQGDLLGSDVLGADGLALEQPDWDMVALSAGLEERVIAPGRHLDELFEKNPILTRLHTTLSAHEMTLDPTFQAVPELGSLAESRVAEALVLRGAEWTAYEVPYEIHGLIPTVDSRAQLCVSGTASGPWPFDDEAIASMPRALRIEELPGSGPVQVLVDNDTAIRIAVAEHNLGTPCETEIPMPEDTGEGSESDGDGASANDSSSASCGCVSAPGSGSGSGHAGLLGLLGLLGLSRLPRRRHPR